MNLVSGYKRATKNLGFFSCFQSDGNNITCTLPDWNWHLASHCTYPAALMCFQKGRCVYVCVYPSMSAVGACMRGCAGSLHSCVSVFVWCVSSLTGLEGEFLNFPADSISFVIGWEKARLYCLLKEDRPLKLRWEQREEKWSRIGYEPATVVVQSWCWRRRDPISIIIMRSRN